MNQATRTLAIELAPQGILVNAVAPGFVATRMSVVDGRNELESKWFRDVYVEYANGWREMYDLKADPNELSNLAGLPEYAAVQRQLAGRLHALLKR